MSLDCVDSKALVMTLCYIVNLYGRSLCIEWDLRQFEEEQATALSLNLLFFVAVVVVFDA